MKQGDQEWLAIHSRSISASRASELLSTGRAKGTRGKAFYSYCAEVAAARCGVPDDELYGTPKAAERGLELQQAALDAYSFLTDSTLSYPAWVWGDDSHTWGCSPDAVIPGVGLVEVKCPLMKTHARIFATGDISDHEEQCQFQLLVTGLDYCDLTFYHPNFPEHARCWYRRIYPDAKVHEVMREAISAANAEIERIVERMKGTL